MRVYFSATITDDQNLRKQYQKIIDILESDGHKVFEYGQEKLDPKELVNDTDDKIREKYRELDSYLKSCDVYIADITEPSVGIGYEISQALVLRKPVLVLKLQRSGFEPLATLEGNKSQYLKYKTYSDSSIEHILKTFIKESKDKIDTKFILIIPPEIDHYLEWNARERGLSKAEVTRNSIEKVMNDDQRFQEYLKEQGLS